MAINGAYLMSSERRDAMNVTPDSSRRARAVDIWAALNSMGRQGLSELVERNCRQAHTLAAALRQAGIEVLNDVVLNQVVVSFGSDRLTNEVIAKKGTRASAGAGERRGMAGSRCGSASIHGRQPTRISNGRYSPFLGPLKTSHRNDL
jgi:glutamate/tyrosine decarboxylase-like PLP-dependent enzyme